MKKIKIVLLSLVCLLALYIAMDGAFAYKKVEESGYMVGSIDAMCINCDNEKEYYVLKYGEGSLQNLTGEETILVASEYNAQKSAQFFQDDRILVRFDSYKISQNGKEIVIEYPSEITTNTGGNRNEG